MKNKIKNLLKNQIFVYTILFILVFAVIFAPFSVRGLSTVWKIDGVGQYYPAFLYIGQYIRDFFSTGRLNTFDLRIAMGEDVFSALNYYGLGDPLNIISVFSNQANGVYLFEFMFFFRLYLAGLSFYLYCKYMKLSERLIVPGAFVYLCSGYMFCACLMYIEFLSPLIYFPLLLLCCEKVFKEKQWWWLVLVSIYASLCTMYLYYYAALVLIPYALIRTIALYKKDIKRIISACLICAGSCVLGMGISFPILYPALKGMLISERASSNVIDVLLTLTYYRPRTANIIKFLKGFLPTYDEGVFFFHEIPLFSYLAVVLLFVSYFALKNKTSRNKQLLISVIIGFIAYTVPITNIVFSGFVDGFSYDRWIFMLEFLFAIVFVCALPEFIETKISNKDLAYKTIYAGTIINVALVGLLLYSSFGKEFRDAFLKTSEVSKYTDSPVNYSEVIKSDGGLYRISNDSLTNINERPENVQMINDYNGLTFWLSVVNPNMQDIADYQTELNANEFVDQRMFGFENNKVYESLSGVKYYLRHDNNNIPESYKLVETIDFNGEKWEVYENPDCLPLCFAYDKEFFEKEFTARYYNSDEQVIKKAIGADSVSYTGNTISCHIDVNTDSVVVLSIPYSEGWTVSIDDKDATVYNSSVYYMAVDVKKGEHDIVFNYSSYK